MKRRLDEAEELLRIAEDDEPLVVQMKLLRLDLLADQRGRRRFERNIRVWVAVIGVFSVISTWTWWSTRHDDRQEARRDERRACLVRQDARDGTREGILAAGIQSAETLIAVTDSQDDPRAPALLERTKADLTEVLDELLPPIAC